jgi:hypothetical protein
MKRPALVKFSPLKILFFFLLLFGMNLSVLKAAPSAHAQAYSPYVMPNTDSNFTINDD